mgnify:CR=1 FL=1
MPKARHWKETAFQNTVTRRVFLYGKPNIGKRSILGQMVSALAPPGMPSATVKGRFRTHGYQAHTKIFVLIKNRQTPFYLTY